MTIPDELEQQILRLHEVEHWRVGTIARQLRVHHSTVRRVLRHAGAAEAAAPLRSSRVDAYRPFIVQTLERFPTLTAARLFVMVCERGYPLRLLTIRQAQRCALALAKAEQVRKRLAIGGDPFAIGYRVGSGGSPNNHHAPGVSDIPDIKDVAADIKSERDHEAAEVNYELQKAAWNKIPSCPFCRSETVLRRFADKGGTLAHVCSNAKCESNTGGYQPLPFYICDVDICDLAPSVLLGTVGKLALIGQSSGTLRRIYAMLGAAPLRDRATKRLVMPSKTSESASPFGPRSTRPCTAMPAPSVASDSARPLASLASLAASRPPGCGPGAPRHA